MSFGQRFTITPLHLITAVSAIANDGILMQPRIVKEIVNSDTGVVTSIPTVQVRQVISKETSETMRDLMESVVTDGTGGYAKVAGYSVGGKTGTSEPSPGKEEEGYTASYVAISPTSNAKVAVLVTLYDPKGDSFQGGQVAGPVVSQILSEVLPYLGLASEEQEAAESSSSLITLTDVRNRTLGEAKKILSNAGFNVHTTSENDELLVTNQVPKPGVSLEEDALISLYTEENEASVSVTVPNVKGMTASQARNSLKSKNLNISIEGSRKSN